MQYELRGSQLSLLHVTLYFLQVKKRSKLKYVLKTKQTADIFSFGMLLLLFVLVGYIGKLIQKLRQKEVDELLEDMQYELGKVNSVYTYYIVFSTSEEKIKAEDTFEEKIKVEVRVEDKANCRYLQLWKDFGMLLLIFVLVGYIFISLSINGVFHGHFKGKRGLHQGGPMSPYLFTHVMEIVTLMLQRRVRDSDSFTYHRYCSKLDIISPFFAGDLFLLTHGDVNLARIIMEALDEFKQLVILHVPPFEEGKLSVKYLGVLLISTRLIYRDCKELVEKVQNRIKDWKNKSLFAAGDMRKGKAKVTWEVVLLPKNEGGLGLRRLEAFNKDVPLRGMLWEWKKTLKLRPLIRQSIWHHWSGRPIMMRLNPFMATVWDCIRPHGDEINWDHVMFFAWLPNVAASLDLIVICLIPMSRKRSARSVIAKLVFAASSYFSWRERNKRLFKNQKRSKDQVIEVIKSSVRLKLLTYKCMKTSNVEAFLQLWKLPNSLIRTSYRWSMFIWIVGLGMSRQSFWSCMVRD
ncbi:hypothetical protein Tco_1362576 [Tanacetum coccineum]